MHPPKSLKCLPSNVASGSGTHPHTNRTVHNDQIFQRTSRRSILNAAGSFLFLQSMPYGAKGAGTPSRVQIPVGDEVPTEARQYFTAAVDAIRQQLGDGFNARLAVYGVTSVLPSGIPGDPSKDYASSGRRGDGHCGAFSTSTDAARPYTICPLPGSVPSDAASAGCCRHLAYCSPYSRLALAVEDRVSTVVVSSRLWSFAPLQWQGVLAHELGHAADFYLFGGRYHLTDHAQALQAAEPALRLQLEAVNDEADAELRADVLCELLVLRDQQLCYDSLFLVQTLTEGGTVCDGVGAGLMRHYTHPPLQGSVRL